MNGLFRGLTLAALSLSLMSAGQAQTTDIPAAQLKALQQKLAQRLPTLPPVESARTTPMSGLIELRSGIRCSTVMPRVTTSLRVTCWKPAPGVI